MLQTIITSLFTTATSEPGRSFGIAISDQSIQFIELIRNKNTCTLGRFAIVPIPRGAILGGVINDERALIATLSVFATTEHLSEVHISIPISRLDTRLSFRTLFKKAKIRVLSVSFEPEAITHAVIPLHDDGTNMIVDFGNTRTEIIIVSSGSVVSAITIPLGGYLLTSAIERALKIPFQDAEKVKNGTGFPETENARADVAPFFLDMGHALAETINRHYVRWHLINKSEGHKLPRVNDIIFSGTNAGISGLREYLSSALRLPVLYANPWTNIPFGKFSVPKIQYGDALRFTAAIGTVVEDSEK